MPGSLSHCLAQGPEWVSCQCGLHQGPQTLLHPATLGVATVTCSNLSSPLLMSFLLNLPGLGMGRLDQELRVGAIWLTSLTLIMVFLEETGYF